MQQGVLQRAVTQSEKEIQQYPVEGTLLSYRYVA